MVTKSAFLYLSKSERFKKFLTRFKSFNDVTRRFVAGEELADAVEAIRLLNRKGTTASFDHLGESITSEAETRQEVNEYIRVLDSIHDSKLDSNVSVKLTQLGLDVSQEVCYANTRTIVEAALRYNNFVPHRYGRLIEDRRDSASIQAVEERIRKRGHRHSSLSLSQ